MRTDAGGGVFGIFAAILGLFVLGFWLAAEGLKCLLPDREM